MSEHTFGSGNNFAVVRWTFERAGQPLRLYGDNSDVLVMTVNDDLTGLVKHDFHIQGIQY
jgi:hypothetical protein